MNPTHQYDVRQRPDGPQPNKLMPLLDERAAAKLLGISPRKLWGLAAAGSIPVIKVGPRLKRYDPRDIQAFIERNRHINQSGCDNAATDGSAGR
jgi:predicted DNA-binding transcriptional regulator AlpA